MYLTGEGILRFQSPLDNNPGATIDVFREPSPLQLSLDFTFGSDGTVYINSWGTDSIERYDPASGQYLGSFVGRGAGGLDSPRGIAFGPDGNLYVASHLTDQILRYDGDTGDFLDVFVIADRGGLRRPLGIHFGPAGQLFVSHYFSDEILRYDGATGRFIDAFVPTGSGGLTRPRASTFEPDGALYVSSQSVSFVREGVTFHDVLRYDGETGEFIDVFAVTSNGRSEGLEFGPDGYLYVGQRTTGSVLRFDGESGALIDEFIPGGLGSSSAGRFVHFGRDGLLYASFQFSGLHRFELIKNGRDVSLGNQQTRAGIDFGSQHTGVGPVEDLTGNGFVDFEDLTVLLANWNKDVTAADGNLVEPLTSVVNFEDLTVLLAAWTGPGAAAAPVGRRLAATIAVEEVVRSDRVDALHVLRQDPMNRVTPTVRRGKPAAYARHNPLRRLQAVAVDRAMVEQSVAPMTLPPCTPPPAKKTLWAAPQ